MELAATELPDTELPTRELPELYVSKAVVEILQALFNSQCPDSVDISIKSTRKLTVLATGSWFYIKVSTSSQIDYELFKDTSNSPCLLELLEKMQQIESESHLCVQNSVGGVTCQQNFVLQGTSLVVQQETRKQKPGTGSSLYLRVHQSHSHMMEESQLIYKVLQVVKIFRPRMVLQFSMKMGENVCRSNYRTSEWLSMGSEIPDIVSVTEFYLHKSSYKPDSDYVKASVTGPDTVSVRVAESAEWFEVTCLGVYIPVLTLLGPGWFPLDISELEEPGLLGDLNLSKLGLKAASAVTDNSNNTSSGWPSCHWKLSVQSTNKHVPMDSFNVQLFLYVAVPAGNWSTLKEFCYIQNHLTVIIEKSSDRLCCITRETLHKSLQSWTEKTKTRTLVYKSIRSVSKAVRDILTMSNNDDFRQEIFGQMQVDNTMDLEKKVQSKLTDISRKRHHGVWNNLYMDSQQAGENAPEISSQLENLQNKPTSTADIHTTSESENNDDPISLREVDKYTRREEDSVTVQNKNNPNRNFIRTDKSQSLVPGLETKTPEINVQKKDVEDVSPFQQLADDLMDAVDDICQTELGGGSEMNEELYGRNQTDNEIMAQLFYENDKDANVCAGNAMENRGILNHNKSVTDTHIKRSENGMVPSSQQVLLLDTRVGRPEILALQKESRLKRSLSFPKDLGHMMDSSSKFYRALSGDRLVPHSLSIHQDHIGLNNESNENLHSNQFCSFELSAVKAKTNNRQSETLPQDTSVSKAETASHSKNYKTNFGTQVAKKSGVEILQDLSQTNRTGLDKDEWDDEFQETFDVVSQFVDDFVDKEMVEIGGHLNLCHIQSQVTGFDKNNNSIKKIEYETKDLDEENDRKAEVRVTDTQTDSDDWFDAAVGDIENWFN